MMSSEITLQSVSGDQSADAPVHQPPGLDEFIDGVRLAFQGGGAKGIVHIGALMAVEELKLPIEAVAGTSAGAMVAVLIAAGYTSQELLDPAAKTHILQQFRAEGYDKAPALFSTAGWATISLFRGIKKRWMPITGLLACMIAGALVLDVFHPGWIIGFGLVAALLTAAIGLWFLHGITTVKPIRDLVDLAIRLKLAERSEKPRDEIPGNLTFEDLYSAILPGKGDMTAVDRARHRSAGPGEPSRSTVTDAFRKPVAANGNRTRRRSIKPMSNPKRHGRKRKPAR
ncbi:patatin-like phospholipase family protein [Burkholderia perseverans]|uniref:patatin-like phospholipase family protein n=1 Tax=Burkholderia perseverans TaxID=2615214 RepID=UPI001FEEEA67|nr:patatin-like phospholipase family protein [Burkholderia perseverans]